MTFSGVFISVLPVCVLLLGACSEVGSERPDDVTRYALPKKLHEVSGLAVAGPDSVLAVADEKAWVYQINVTDGKVERRVKLGDPVLRGDFEGIAMLDDRLYLVTSDGRLVHGRLSATGDVVTPTVVETGVGEYCEVEGLAVRASGTLALVCKTARDKALKRKLAVFSVDPAQSAPAELVIEVDVDQILEHVTGKKFNPSGIERLGDGSYLVVAARQRAYAVITEQGEVVRAGSLPVWKMHRQTEGVTAMPDGRLVLADEGGDGKAMLSVYPDVF